ncbi:MAG: succinate dehydrogenase cytochrome b subunit [Deltaproteobacteria bacterium]|nr:succinate dehydrogenase cytochrome b subunit [Deltaproteobacteria bacterium]
MPTQTLGFIHTSVGKKVLMAVTGLFMFLFVVVHLLGNLQIYAGPQAINNYAKFLHSLGNALWGARIVMLVCIAVHIYYGLTLWLQSRSAGRGGSRYHKTVHQAATLSSKWMILTGPLMGGYIVYHLLHLTLGTAHPDFTTDVYRNLVVAFTQPAAAGIYIVLMLALGLHLWHGLWSMFQTAGLNGLSWSSRIRAAAMAITGLVALGNVSIPIAVLVGFIK